MELQTPILNGNAGNAVSHRSQIVVRGLSYSVDIGDPSTRRRTPFSPKPRVSKTILSDINVAFQPGRLTAILGASGAGKTSLLYAVAGTLSQGNVSGNILVNGQEVGGNEMRQLSGFVFQDDLLFPTMTVRESLNQSATLRLPENMSKEEKARRVDETLKTLRLESAADTIIGGPSVKGISGGERKRLCIGMELITNPAVLFLDEPTSGLDSFTAYSVVSTLKNLAESGRTIVTTIHQPSSEIFAVFDDLLILAAGKVVYFGPATETVSYFSKLGFPCPTYSNPADFLFMSILNPKLDPSPVPQLIAHFPTDPLYEPLRAAIDKPASGGIKAEVLKQQAHFGTQFGFLYQRALKNAVRNKLMLRARAGQALVLNLLVGLIFWDIPSRGANSQVQDRAGFMFFLSAANLLTAMLNVLAIFALEKHVFEREHGARYYGLPAYFSSKILVEMPYQIAFPIIGTTISYFMSGLQRNGEQYIIAALYCVLLSLCGFALGITLGSVFESLEVALSIVPLVFMPILLFTGLLVNSGNIPAWLDWIKYLAPTKYGFEGLFKNEFVGLQLPLANGARMPGAAAVSQFGLDDGLGRAELLSVIAAFVVGLLMMGYFGLWRVISRNERSMARVRGGKVGGAAAKPSA